MYMAEGLDNGHHRPACHPIDPNQTVESSSDGWQTSRPAAGGDGGAIGARARPAFSEDAKSCYAPMLPGFPRFSRSAKQILRTIRSGADPCATTVEIKGRPSRSLLWRRPNRLLTRPPAPGWALTRRDQRGLRRRPGTAHSGAPGSGQKRMQAVDYLRGHALFD